MFMLVDCTICRLWMALTPPARLFMTLILCTFSVEFVCFCNMCFHSTGEHCFCFSTWHLFSCSFFIVLCLMGGAEGKKKAGGNERAWQCMHYILADRGWFLKQEGCVWNKDGRDTQRYDLEVLNCTGKSRSGSWTAENEWSLTFLWCLQPYTSLT